MFSIQSYYVENCIKVCIYCIFLKCGNTKYCIFLKCGNTMYCIFLKCGNTVYCIFLKF
jgi:hypothetical protein